MNLMKVDLSNPRNMVLQRIFDAPRDLVWKCWTDPEHLAVWWGPEGFTNRIDIDVRPGGQQDIVMVAPDGTEYPIAAHYTEIVEGEKIVSKFGDSDHPGNDVISTLVMTVTFEDTDDGKTLLTVRQTFNTQDQRDRNMEMGARKGWGESFVKLDSLLTNLVSSNG